MNERLDYLKFYARSVCNALLRKMKLKALRTHYSKPTLKGSEAQDYIRDMILTGAPAMIARYGSNEALATADSVGVALGLRRKIAPKHLRMLNNNAGVFPKNEEIGMRFGNLMIESSKQVDLLGTWDSFMQYYLIERKCNPHAKLTFLGNLEPYYFSNPWSAALKGKRVVVVHPFQKTIEEQWKKREKLFANPDTLPECELRIVKAVQTIAQERDARFETWFDALDYMFAEVMKEDFDVAIIGCGAYGFPLAAKIKEAGKIAIHLGGATQLLFGIKGKRWDNSPSITALSNENWIRPFPEDTPAKANIVENGCYW